MTEKLEVTTKNAAKFWEWVTKRGGIACWTSLDLSSGGRTVYTPANTEEGQPMARPHWQYPAKPQRVVTTSFDVVVRVGKLHKTISAGGHRKSFEAAQKIDPHAWLEDRSDGKADIMVTERMVPLMDWISEQNTMAILDKVVQP